MSICHSSNRMLYKNLKSNEPLCQFGLSDTPASLVCGANESVKCQLHSSHSSQRMWTLYSHIFAGNVGYFYDIIKCNGTLEQEMVRSALLYLSFISPFYPLSLSRSQMLISSQTGVLIGAQQPSGLDY